MRPALDIRIASQHFPGTALEIRSGQVIGLMSEEWRPLHLAGLLAMAYRPIRAGLMLGVYPSLEDALEETRIVLPICPPSIEKQGRGKAMTVIWRTEGRLVRRHEAKQAGQPHKRKDIRAQIERIAKAAHREKPGKINWEEYLRS